jgi:hypothetical protein
VESRVSDHDTNLDAPVRLQYLEALRQAAYQSFNDRRSYEWKLSLAIWTALAIVVVGLVRLQTGEVFPLHGPLYGIVATVVGILIVVLHIYFNNGMARANAIDKTRFQHCASEMESILDLKTDPKVQALIDQLPAPPKGKWMRWWQWGHLAQIGITILLTIVAVGFVWLRVIA